jgi:hypothetical protein
MTSIGIMASGRLNNTTTVKRGSGTPATTGTSWGTVTSAVDGTPPANPATYAIFTNAVSSGVGTIEVSGYDFSAIPAGATIISAQASIRHLCSVVAGWTSGVIQAFDGATAIGSTLTVTLATSARNDVLSFTPTVAQLQSATFKIRATLTHAANTTSRTFSIDHIDVTVVYQ